MNAPVSARFVADNGLGGRITDTLRADDGTSYVFVEFDNGERARIPSALLQRQADGSLYVPLCLQQLSEAEITPDGLLVIPVIAEEARISKPTVATGRVQVRKIVREREQVIDEPLFREEIHVERVAINREVDTPPEVRREGETVIVPVVEEVLVVEKRLILKEELHITRHQTTAHDPQQVTLRSEEVRVERLAPASDEETSGQ